jgi:sugar lactone lactonase YvrE
MSSKPELLLQSDAEVGEGPIFLRDSLLWVDIPVGKIHKTNLENFQTETLTLDTHVGAIAPFKSGKNFAVACKEGFAVLEDGTLDIRDPFLGDSNYRMNDAKCDALGRLWGGSCQMDFESGKGQLHRWDGGNSNKVMVENLSLPNGLGWNSENTLMYLADSMTKKVFVSEFDLADDFVPNFRELISIGSGVPDGLAVDVEGCIWLAVWGGSRVMRISAQGEVLEEHLFPVSQPSSCAFGSDGTLYVTSARAGISEAELVNQPLAGSLFTLSTSTAGVPVSGFKESDGKKL